ncbi:MAG: DNA polymerase I [Elusimicrobia bacterium]|nr:DNA polymerase I [Elusimicrobiota bacterium]
MTLYLIDGNSYIHRAYHAIKNLTTSKGEPVNAVYGFTKMLVKILKENNPDYIAVCMDYPAPTFRHKEFSEYKVKRKKADPELKSQFPLVKEIISALNIALYEKEGYEADDVIATISKKAENKGIKVVIVSNDKDILQLVNKNINVLNEPQNILYDTEKVTEKWGFPPERMTDFLALAGDSSDNIPGIPGIGEKTAVKLIEEFGDINNVIKNRGKIEGKAGLLINEHSKSAVLSKKLVVLVKDIPMNIDIERLKPKESNNEKLLAVLKRLEFYSLIKVLVKEKEQNIDKTDYQIISDEGGIERLCKYLESKKEFSFYTAVGSGNSLVGFAVSAEKGKGFYIPVGHRTLTSGKQIPGKDVKKHLCYLFKNENILKITYNLKSQINVLEKIGIEVLGKYFDIEIASYLLSPSGRNSALQDVIIEYLGIKKDEPGTDIEGIEIEEAKRIFSESSDLIFQCKHIIESKILDKKMQSLFWDIEMPLVNILHKMETAGILIDEEYFKNLSLYFSEELKKLEKIVYSQADEEFNINSPKQLSRILFDKLGLNPVKKTKTGYSTNEEVLKILSKASQLPGNVLSYREISKLKSTFVDALIEKINPDTKRLHTLFNQTVTLTGRLSSSEPNLQNIPVKTELGRRIRRGFIPEKKSVFVSFDYSQIDLRVLAHITKDVNLSDAFRKGRDIHTATAIEVFGTDEMRNKAKGINFGIVYGQQAWGLSQQLGVSAEEAQNYIDKYFKRYSGVKKWILKTIDEAKKSGYVSTLLGRIRYLPEINHKNGQLRAFAERTAINTPIQGTSADIIKIAMVRIDENLIRRLADKNKECKMLLQVHDDLLFEIAEDKVSNYLSIIKSEMENAMKLDVPLIVDVKTGVNWADLNEIKKKK